MQANISAIDSSTDNRILIVEQRLFEIQKRLAAGRPMQRPV